MTLGARWEAAWRALGVRPLVRPGAETVLARYREPHRTYHTERHLRECLRWLDRVAHLARQPPVLELALWYHDAIYRPRRSDNEAASAALAQRHFRKAGVPAPATRAVGNLIRWTAHRATPPPGDSALIVDIDLAILGAPAARFAEYERQIRREYDWVSDATFRRRRAAILRRFLSRPRLFTTPLLFERLERRARVNLARSLSDLGEP